MKILLFLLTLIFLILLAGYRAISLRDDLFETCKVKCHPHAVTLVNGECACDLTTRYP